MLTCDQFEVMHTLRSEFRKRGYSLRKWWMDATPEEKAILNKYRKKSRRRGAAGGLFGATVMGLVWSVAALSTGWGIAGVIVGGAIGAKVATHKSGYRRKMIMKLLMLPDEKAPHAAEARRILEEKLPNNSFVKELKKNSALNADPTSKPKWAPETTKDK